MYFYFIYYYYNCKVPLIISRFCLLKKEEGCKAPPLTSPKFEYFRISTVQYKDIKYNNNNNNNNNNLFLFLFFLNGCKGLIPSFAGVIMAHGNHVHLDDPLDWHPVGMMNASPFDQPQRLSPESRGWWSATATQPGTTSPPWRKDEW